LLKVQRIKPKANVINIVVNFLSLVGTDSTCSYTISHIGPV
jgi:hypothetical protein